ncbi:hypothetical protein JCM8547_007453 [Rhodosporidiobolus lusitaniae]
MPQPTARRSSLTFKGPSSSTRVRKPPTIIDPVPERRKSSEGSASGARKKRRVSTESKASTSTSAREREKRNAEEKPAKKKRRRSPSPNSASGSDESDDESTTRTRPYERHLPRSLVKRTWRVLSEGSREDLRWEAEREGRELLDDLPPARAKAVQALLSRFNHEFNSLLATLPLPPLPSSIRRASKGKGKIGTVDLGDLVEEDELERRITALEQAYAAEQATVEALGSRLEEEQRLHDRDSATLQAFQFAREKLEEAESADVAAMSNHPLLAPLLSSRVPVKEENRHETLVVPGLPAPHPDWNAESKAGGVSREWFTIDGMRKRSSGDGDEEEQEQEEEPSDLPTRLASRTKLIQRELKERKKGRKLSE